MFTIRTATAIQWPFSSNSVSADASSLITTAMRQNVGRTIGFDISSVESPIPILHYSQRFSVQTIVTSLPHGLETNDQADLYIDGRFSRTITFTGAPSDFDLTFSSANLGGLENPSAANAYLICKNKLAPNKLDLTSMNRNILIRCLLNNSIEVGSIHVPTSSMRFLARVQVISSPNSVQFVQELLHSLGLYELVQPIKSLVSVRLELYNENGLDFYDTHGVDWSIVLECMCDNNGN